MASFEELLTQLKTQNEYDALLNNLSYNLADKSKHILIYSRIQPFLPHVEDGGELQALSNYLQSPFKEERVLKTLIHNVINAAKSNERLKQVLYAVLGI